MTTQQTDNMNSIVDSLNKYGITNKAVQAGILATVSKESNFVPSSENMNYTTLARLKAVFPKIPDSVAPTLVGNPEALGNYVYSSTFFPSGGNGSSEGYKYRGRGYNQITFKNTYDRIGKLIGQDLVDNPDLLNDPKVAGDALAVFYKGELDAGQQAGSFKKFGVDNVNDISDTTTATKVAIQINAGRGTNFNNNVVQEGYTKASAIVDSIYDMIKSASTATASAVSEGAKTVSETTSKAVEEVKKKPLTTIVVTTLLIVSVFMLIKTLRTKTT